MERKAVLLIGRYKGVIGTKPQVQEGLWRWCILLAGQSSLKKDWGLEEPFHLQEALLQSTVYNHKGLGTSLFRCIPGLLNCMS